MRFTVGRPAPLTHQFEDTDGEPLTFATLPTVKVTRQGAAAPTITSTTQDLGGSWYGFTAYGLTQGVYTIQWLGDQYTDTEQIEVVGGELFSIREIRKAHDRLADKTKYPTATLKAIRDLVAQEFEVITGRSFVPRTVRVPWLTGDMLPRLDVASVTLQDSTGTTVETGPMESVGPYAFLPEVAVDAVLSAELDYGYRQTPDDVKQAALLRAKDLLFERDNGIPDRATSYQPGDGGTYILSQAGRRGATTGLPDVDAVLARYTFTIEDSIGGFW